MCPTRFQFCRRCLVFRGQVPAAASTNGQGCGCPVVGRTLQLWQAWVKQACQEFVYRPLHLEGWGFLHGLDRRCCVTIMLTLCCALCCCSQGLSWSVPALCNRLLPTQPVHFHPKATKRQLHETINSYTLGKLRCFVPTLTAVRKSAHCEEVSVAEICQQYSQAVESVPGPWLNIVQHLYYVTRQP